MAKYSVRNKKDTSLLKKRFLIAGIVLILMGGVLFTLEKTGVTNFYSRGTDVSDETAGKRGVNDVDYSPASDSDNDDINARKEDGSIDQEPNTPDKDTAIQIVFIASSQDTNGGPLIIRTQLYGVTSGTCNLTLTNGGSVQKSSSVELQNTTYTCRFDVPKNELPDGNWDVKLEVVTQDGRRNEATTSTTIN